MADGEICTCTYRSFMHPEEPDVRVNPCCPRHGDGGDLEGVFDETNDDEEPF